MPFVDIVTDTRVVIDRDSWIVCDAPASFFHRKTDSKVVRRFSAISAKTPVQFQAGNRLASVTHINTLEEVDVTERSNSKMMVSNRSAKPLDNSYVVFFRLGDLALLINEIAPSERT